MHGECTVAWQISSLQFCFRITFSHQSTNLSKTPECFPRKIHHFIQGNLENIMINLVNLYLPFAALAMVLFPIKLLTISVRPFATAMRRLCIVFSSMVNATLYLGIDPPPFANKRNKRTRLRGKVTATRLAESEFYSCFWCIFHSRLHSTKYLLPPHRENHVRQLWLCLQLFPIETCVKFCWFVNEWQYSVGDNKSGIKLIDLVNPEEQCILGTFKFTRILQKILIRKVVFCSL